MARPRVFVSSTYYDLKHLRSSLENFIESLGYDAILSEKGEVAYAPDLPLDASCYREVGNADIFVIIIGGRYGSEKSEGRTRVSKVFYERYDSITREEYKAAVSKDIPIYVLIERTVYSDYETYLRNKDYETINYAHVDSVNIFRMIEEILGQPKGNPIYQFEKYSDIQYWLKEQWAGLFRDLLYRVSNQSQIAGLSSQVRELAEINKTLKAYLEEVVTKVAPDDATRLIKSESDRLKEANLIQSLRENGLVRSFEANYGLDMAGIINAGTLADSPRDFLEKLSCGEDFVANLTPLHERPNVIRSINDIRQKLGLSPFPLPDSVEEATQRVVRRRKSPESKD